MKAARILCMILVCTALASQLHAQANIKDERERAKAILKIVSQDIEKNYYDSTMGGLDWRAVTEEARVKVDSAQSVGQIYTAIFVLADRLHNSHTMFVPPQRTVRPLFGFEAKAYGDKIYVHELKKDGAALASGLKLGDRILKVNNYDVTRATFNLLMLYYRVLQPVVRLQLVIQRGNEQPQQLLIDAKIKQRTTTVDLTNDSNVWEMIREEENNMEKSYYGKTDSDGIGYLNLSSFSSNPDWFYNFVGKIKHPQAIIVDLRGNPGGRVDSLATFAGFFDPEPSIMADMISRKKNEPLKVKPQRNAFNIPFVIMVDSESASAAEMFARHFQRMHKAVVIGDQTSGRVTASRFFDEKLGVDSIVMYGVQVAVARVVFPGGEELENKGVTPDQFCLPTADDLRDKHDPCLVMARSTLLKALGKSPVKAEEEKKTAPEKPGSGN